MQKGVIDLPDAPNSDPLQQYPYSALVVDAWHVKPEGQASAAFRAHGFGCPVAGSVNE